MPPAVKRELLEPVFRLVNHDAGAGWIHGLTDPAKAFVVARLRATTKRACVVVFPRRSQAEQAYWDLGTLLPDDEVLLIPSPDQRQHASYLATLSRLEQNASPLAVASVSDLLQTIPAPAILHQDLSQIRVHEPLSRDHLTRWLSRSGYQRAPLVEEPGDWAVRGAIVDCYCPASSRPARVEFFGDTVESIREFNPRTQRSVETCPEVTLYPARVDISGADNDSGVTFLDYLDSQVLLCLCEPGGLEQVMESETTLRKQMAQTVTERPLLLLSLLPGTSSLVHPAWTAEYHSAPIQDYAGRLDVLLQDLRQWTTAGYRVTFFSGNPGQASRLEELLAERHWSPRRQDGVDIITREPGFFLSVGDLSAGFILKDTGHVFVTDQNIFRRYQQRRARWTPSSEEARIQEWTELAPGDYVVHLDHGIGRFHGITTLRTQGQNADYFRIDYRGTDRLYVPVDQLDRLHKYLGDPDRPPPIYTLEGGTWNRVKRKAKEASRELAQSLLRHYSLRQTSSGHAFQPDQDWQLEFEAAFPYQETPDQLRAAEETKRSMERAQPMDRLVCGDAGYGKTEVAMRASFKAVLEDKQVAVLVPTTILAEQHFETFRERMAAYPLHIALLSRFQTAPQQKQVLRDLQEGRTDIVVGTHRLLQRDVGFKNLGLIVIDEEQRFGVLQKKRLRDLHQTVDVLTLTATPIPRSLHMALSGVTEMSVIATPPEARHHVETWVGHHDPRLIRDAIVREIEREGQVFYLHNRIAGIHAVALRVTDLVPHARVAVAHGRMSAPELEEVIRAFINGVHDVLVCTSIIESGIDMPNVNTLIVENAHQFGLGDLYQLRGRVGRGRRQGYAYFLFRQGQYLTEEAAKRLQVIKEFNGSGSGFRIALQDLQIRGAGNLLGKEQHGHIAAIGFTLYIQLIQEEIERAKGHNIAPDFPINLDLGVETRLPSSYIPEDDQRFALYSRVGAISEEQEILDLKQELRDRYGPLPRQARMLLQYLKLKLLARSLGITSLQRRHSGVWVTLAPHKALTPEAHQALAQSAVPGVSALPLDYRHLSVQTRKSGDHLIFQLEEILQRCRNVL